jgi:hypothetical protein
MIPAPLAVIALVFTIATGSATITPPAPMSAQQKSAAMQPLVRSATECIANSVADDPRFLATARADLSDLIVDSIPPCVTRLQAMIDACDRYYGAGSGKAFFVGPYLDILPRAVGEWLAQPSH